MSPGIFLSGECQRGVYLRCCACEGRAQRNVDPLAPIRRMGETEKIAFFS